METTRERIARLLRGRSMAASELADAVDADRAATIEHVHHVARSLEEEELVVAPPECRDCGFDRFDDPANVPSRCPECRSEAIEDPAFAIR